MSDLVADATWAFTFRIVVALLVGALAAYAYFGAHKRGLGLLLALASLGAFGWHVYANRLDREARLTVEGDADAMSVERLTSALRCCATPEKVTPLEPFAAQQCLGHMERARVDHCRDDASCTSAARACEKQRGLLDERVRSPSSLGR